MEESGRASHDAHLSDDETVAKMGHPVLCKVDCGWMLVDGGM